MTLNEKAKEIHADNVAKGFYDDYIKMKDALHESGNQHLIPELDRVFNAQRIALIQSEASEALEAMRKDKTFIPWPADLDLESLDDEQFKNFYEHHIKGSEEEEIADTKIRLFDYSGFKQIDLDLHIELKLRYNRTRPYKHGKKM